MTDLLASSWFYWAIGVAVGLPVLVVTLTEVQHTLAHRHSPLIRPITLIRNYILPLGALLLLLVKGSDVSPDATPVRVISTGLAFVVLILLLSGLNVTLFHGAPEGSWRNRIPTIFLDVARFVLIALGLALILSYIWGANVGGLFTALGVTSIVLGLALQNSVGQVISGLLLLFEQPFELGDWIDTPSARGRVVEVNWRATHIDTGARRSPISAARRALSRRRSAPRSPPTTHPTRSARCWSGLPRRSPSSNRGRTRRA